jgi:F0F1-type ATP synthase membrane subunit b/b'
VDDEGEGGETDSEYEVDGDERHKKRKTVTGASEDTQALVVALKDFGDGIEKAIVKSAEVQSGSKAVEDLKAKIEADQKQRDKQREEDKKEAERIREEDKKEAERIREEDKKEAERIREEDKKEAEKSRGETREMFAALLAKLNN